MNASRNRISRFAEITGQEVPAGRRASRHLAAMAALAIATFSAGALADVGASIVTSNPTPVVGGAAFSYTVVLTNNDQVNPATDVVMTLPMPSGVRFQGLSISGSAAPPDNGTGASRADFACLAPPVGENGMITCKAVSMPASTATTPSRTTILIVAQIDGNIASGVRTATARVISGGVGFSASIQQNLQVDAPLSITKSGPANIVPGANIIYQIMVNNGGSSTALNVTIQDNLPANVSFLSMHGTGAFHDGCNVNPNNVIVCAAVDIPSGLTTLTVVAKVSPNTPLGPLSNTATINNAGTGTIAVGTSTTVATVVAP